MTGAIKFILNDRVVSTEEPAATVLVDFIRKEKALVGTKVACREGDCGACTVLVGDLSKNQIHYKTITSCIYPLGNVAGKHVVTVEGINGATLTPVQDALVKCGGTQCGFCTPGFVMSMTGYLLKTEKAEAAACCSELDGNICRCTGYKSIERAAQALCEQLDSTKIKMKKLIECGVVPAYFETITTKLKELNADLPSQDRRGATNFVGGGSDLYVQIPEKIVKRSVYLTKQLPELRGIRIDKRRCIIGAATSIEELRNSEELLKYFPEIKEVFKLFGSTPIRESATVGGNIANASPIGDSTAFFLALNSDLSLFKDGKTRRVELAKFYLGYKKLDLKPGEMIAAVEFDLPTKGTQISFEKVSRRTYLDIASVNSVAQIEAKAGVISAATFSAGGVAATPLVLKKTSAFAVGKKIDVKAVREIVEVACSEVTPISDVRGTKEYKNLLLRQLMFAHFVKLYPEKITLKALL